MKLELTTWQRMNCVDIIGGISGISAAGFRKVAKLLDILEMTDEEKRQVGYIDESVSLRCDLTGLKSRFGIDITGAWIGSEEGAPQRRPGDIFIEAQVPTRQRVWDDLEHRWTIEIKSKTLATLFRENVEAFKWPDGWQASKEWRDQIVDLYDRLGIEEEE